MTDQEKDILLRMLKAHGSGDPEAIIRALNELLTINTTD